MDRIKSFFYNLSIRKTLIVYTIVLLLLATFLSTVTINMLQNMDNIIFSKYRTLEESVFTNDSGGMITLFLAEGDERIEYTKIENILLIVSKFARSAAVPVYFGTCIILGAFLFYRNKLKKPIDLINEAAEKIAQNDLDFSLLYDSKDEMGQLCASLETMRDALDHNNREMWRMMEERKRLNAAFAHDLRTPLTVLRGYSDFLCKYVPQGKISEEKLLSTVSAISNHAERLESYVETMSVAQKLEDILISVRETSVNEFLKQLYSIVQILEEKTAIEMNVANKIENESIYVDSKIIMQVIENLLSNGLRYAKKKIEVHLKMRESELIVEVFDDGKGFSSDDLKIATKAFFRDQSSDHNHFGLGLYICKTLCEKHGGELILTNSENGGAKVTATFLSNS